MFHNRLQMVIGQRSQKLVYWQYHNHLGYLFLKNSFPGSTSDLLNLNLQGQGLGVYVCFVLLGESGKRQILSTKHFILHPQETTEIPLGILPVDPSETTKYITPPTLNAGKKVRKMMTLNQSLETYINNELPPSFPIIMASIFDKTTVGFP